MSTRDLPADSQAMLRTGADSAALPEATGHTPLSPSDVLCIGHRRTMLLVYRRCPDAELIKRKLITLCEDVPDICSTIRKCNDNNFYFIRNADGIPLPVIDLPHPLPDYGRDALIDDERQPLAEPHHSIDEPLLRFKIKRFSCGGAILEMDLSHALADGVGRSLLLSRLARSCRDSTPLPVIEHNRSQLIELAQRFQDPEGDQDLVQVQRSELFRRLKTYMTEPRAYAVARVSAQALDDLWSGCRVSGEGRYITRQDVLVAKIWQAFSLIRPESSVGKLLTTLDFRRNPEVGVSRAYLGNAVTGGQIDYQTEHVREASMATLALQIRASVEDALSIRKISQYLHCCWRGRDERGLVLMKKDELDRLEDRDFAGELCINNLSRFPIRDLDFGTGIPFWVGGIKQLRAPSVAIFPLSGEGESGYALHINVSEQTMRQLLAALADDPFFDVQPTWEAAKRGPEPQSGDARAT